NCVFRVQFKKKKKKIKKNFITMESNIINWIYNSNEFILDILLSLSKNGFYISKSSLKKLINSPNKISEKSEQITLINLDFINDKEKINTCNVINVIIINNICLNQRHIIRVTEESRIDPNGVKYEIIPKNYKSYFDKKLPLELSHLISSNQYINFIKSINSAYNGHWIKFLVIFFYIIGLMVYLILLKKNILPNQSWIFIVVLSSISFSLIIFHLIYSHLIKYIIIKKIIYEFNKKLIFQMNYSDFHKFIEFKLIRKKKKFIQTNDKITLEFVYYPRNSINNNNNINEFNL
ncbi:hypothetical protein DDB_G0290155, partial [Dictyostelium discoideum AX4]